MSLYGRTDSNANKTKAGRGVSASSQAKQILFIDDTEAALAENKARGLNAPGWWSYFTYTDSEGHTRHKAEMLVTIAGPDLNANETQADDAAAADVSVTITIGTQPADASNVADGASTNGLFTIAATPSTGGASVIEFQWQKQSPNSKRWTNMSAGDGMTFQTGLGGGAKTGQINASSIAKSTWDGYKFRVKVTTTNGATEVISDTATLTFA